jgi:hypothetical protein
MEELLLSVIECVWVSNISQTEICTTELLVSKYSYFAVQIAIDKLKTEVI